MTDGSLDRPVLSTADRGLLKLALSPTDAQIDDTRRAIGARIAALAACGAVAQAASSAHATAATATVTTTTAVGTTAAGAAAAGSKSIALLGAAKWISAGLIATAVAGGAVMATRSDTAREERALQHAPTNVSASATARPALGEPASAGQPSAAPTERTAAPTPKATDAPYPMTHPMMTPRPTARRATREAKPARAIETESLSGELALLRAARQALEGNNPTAALEQLDAHAARYPNAALRQEALAARALALCATGRDAEAQRAAAQLARIAPRSPHLIRLADSCAIADAKARE